MGSNPNIDGASIRINNIQTLSLRDNRGGTLSASVIPAGSYNLAVKDGDNNYFRLLLTGGPLYTTGSTATPTLGDGTNNFTLSGTSYGTYTKIGDLVTVYYSLAWSSIGSAGAGQLVIGALPFATNSDSNARFAACIGALSGFDTAAGAKQITARAASSATTIAFFQTEDNAAPTNLAANGCSASGSLVLTITYKA